MHQRLTIHLSESLAEQVRDDADAKGQTLSMWFTRAAESALASKTALRHFSETTLEQLARGAK